MIKKLNIPIFTNHNSQFFTNYNRNAHKNCNWNMGFEENIITWKKKGRAKDFPSRVQTKTAQETSPRTFLGSPSCVSDNCWRTSSRRKRQRLPRQSKGSTKKSIGFLCPQSRTRNYSLSSSLPCSPNPPLPWFLSLLFHSLSLSKRRVRWRV